MEECEVEYLPIGRKDAESIADMYERYLNGGEGIREHIRAGIEEEDYTGYKAVCGGRLAGFVSGRAGIDFTYPHPELKRKIEEMFPGKKIYSPDAMVVAPEFRKMQTARTLGRKVIQSVYDKGYNLLVTELWIYPDGSVPALKPVLRWGRPVYQEKVPGFYKDSDRYGITCPICGSHCTCGALITVLELDEDTLHML